MRMRVEKCDENKPNFDDVIDSKTIEHKIISKTIQSTTKIVSKSIQ